jgi:hypothetical protein
MLAGRLSLHHRGAVCAGSLQRRFQLCSSRPLPTCTRSAGPHICCTSSRVAALARPWRAVPSKPQTDVTDDLLCNSIVHSSLRRHDNIHSVDASHNKSMTSSRLYGTPRPACAESEFSATSTRKVLDGYRNLCNATNKQCMSSDTSATAGTELAQASNSQCSIASTCAE